MSYCHFNDGGGQQSFSISLFGKDISIFQNPASKAVGHGAVVWDAAVIFSKYMENNPADFESSKMISKTVLELGSGCALAGISLMLRGCKVSFTDMKSVVDTMTRRNVQTMYRILKSEEDLSSIIQEPTVSTIDWTIHEPYPVDSLLESYDLILLTDCVFSMELVDDLVGTILQYTTSKTTVICCHEIRDEIASDAFVKKMSEHFRIKKINKSKLHPEYSNEFVELFTAKPLRSKK